MAEIFSRMALCYDFDKTLSPDNMQTFDLIPSFDIDANEFWEQSNKLARENLMDDNLAWMYLLIKYSEFKNKSVRKEHFYNTGKNVPLYTGVETWFDRLNSYAAKKGIDLQHYIISSGLKEIIEGSIIADKINRIYASSYYYSKDGVVKWPAQAVNYTNKTQFIFRIAKGVFEEYDSRVNDSFSEDELYISHKNFVYIGDSETDIPCMRLVKSQGGYSIGVYDANKGNKERVHKLYKEGRISFYAPADYSEGSALEQQLIKIIDEVSAREALNNYRRNMEE
ncbi:MAG: haloacid dehalogenase-like hydrolase [Clostridia bacterium]|nr:haloacid dehalogenase-like hydrolase [Clostridia bacterium]